MPTAYSYLRFSKPEQAEGDTLRRQIANRESWLKSHPQIPLDTTLEMTDAGLSGYDRDDWDAYALAGFLRKAESGYVKQGDYLLVENLDRLSREKEVKGTRLFLSILEKGITIVQLSPSVKEFTEESDMADLMHAIMELSRGHRESKIKSERVRAAWANKRTKARAGTVTGMRLPGWLQRGADANAMPTVIESKAAIVRRLFKLAFEGVGLAQIARQLNDEGVKPFGKAVIAARGQRHLPTADKNRHTVTWTKGLIHNFLTSPSAIGKYHPHTGRGKNRKPDGDAVTLYPAIVTERDYYAVQSALASRSKRGAGRRGKHVNLFAGIITDMRTGGAMTCEHSPGRAGAIIPANAVTGAGDQWSSFPLTVFESAILSALQEVTVADIQGEDDAAKNVSAIAGRIKKLEASKATWLPKMYNPDIAADVERHLTGINLTLRGLNEELATARRAAANPIAEAWGECRSLIGLLENNPSDEMRLKVKAALRRSISDVKCLFTGPHRRLRLAAVVVVFRSGATQGYFLSHHRLAKPITQCVSIRHTKVEIINPDLGEKNLLAAAKRATEKGTSPLAEYCKADWPNESWTRIFQPK
ncbi:MAG: hypothetical protein C0467_13125 [Planctomycetaceae bacterium]|nr:hypothetical protein [Planctomycetaceae bacterium]